MATVFDFNGSGGLETERNLYQGGDQGSFGKYRVQQISAHSCDRGGGFVEAISFLAEKNCLAVSLIGSTCVCFCRKTVLPVFNLTQFDWLPAHLREMK